MHLSSSFRYRLKDINYFMIRSALYLCMFIFCAIGVRAQEKAVNSSNNHSVTILFIGNSLTYTNNLPLLVKEEARKYGVLIEFETLAFPNYAIADHWRDGNVQSRILNGKFDFVIIQQGPSSQAEGRQMLIEYGKKFQNLCRKSGAELCYFMVWPSLNYYRTFNDVIKNHKDAALINQAILLPVGEVWKNYLEETEDLVFYGPDGFHPSLEGSIKAAHVIVEHLFGN